MDKIRENVVTFLADPTTSVDALAAHIEQYVRRADSFEKMYKEETKKREKLVRMMEGGAVREMMTELETTKRAVARLEVRLESQQANFEGKLKSQQEKHDDEIKKLYAAFDILSARLVDRK